MLNYTKYDSFVLKSIWNPLHIAPAAFHLFDRHFLISFLSCHCLPLESWGEQSNSPALVQAEHTQLFPSLVTHPGLQPLVPLVIFKCLSCTVKPQTIYGIPDAIHQWRKKITFLNLKAAVLVKQLISSLNQQKDTLLIHVRLIVRRCCTASEGS